MISKGALERVPDPDPGFYSRLFLVEKASGGWRPVIDLSPFNEFVQQTPFKMETTSSVLLSVRRGDFLASIDLKDAYFQIPVHTSSRKWLRFVPDGAVHQFKVLCFGLSTAPQVFTRVFATVSAWALTRGGSFSPVPGRLAGPSLYRGQSQAARPGPSIPVQLPRGSTQQKEVRPQPVTVGGVSRHDHRHSGCPNLPYSTSHRQIPRHGEQIPIASGTPRPALAGVVGTHVIAGEAGPPQKTQNALTPMASEVTLVPGDRPSNLPIPRSQQVEEDLSWWMVRDHLLEGTPFGTPTPDLRLYSDASRAGWGAHLLDQSVLGVWSHQENSLHINLLEMKALFLALRSFKDLVTDHRVTAMCDNSTVVAYVNKQGCTVSDSLCSLTGQLL